MTLDDLTDYQRDIASLVRCGLTNRQIAVVLNIAPGSVANTLGTIYGKLGICGPKGAKRVKLAVMVVQGKKDISPLPSKLGARHGEHREVQVFTAEV